MSMAALDPKVRKVISDLEAEYRTLCDDAVKRERDNLVAYQQRVAEEVALAEKDIGRSMGGGTVRFNRLRSVLHLDEFRPKPRVGLCRFAR